MDKDALRRYLVSGGAWAFAGKVLTAFMGLAFSALLARLLAPEDMGAYFLAFNLATFFSILARMGMENTLLRFVSEAVGRNQSARAKDVIRKGMILALVNASVVAVVVGAGGGAWVAHHLFHSSLLGAVTGFVAIWLVLLAFQFLFGEIFRAFQDIRSAVLFGGLTSSVGTVIFVTAYMVVKGSATLSQVLPLILAAGGLNIVLALWILVGKLRGLPASPKDQDAGYWELVSHSWPLLIYAVTSFMLSRSDLWILAAFGSDEEVAIYGAAARLVLLTGMALAIVNAVVPPLIARLHVQDDKQHLEHILRKAATFAAIPAFVVLSVFIFFGSWVLDVIFGEYYHAGGAVLMILSMGQVVNVFVGSCGYTLVMTGHRRTMMLISITSASIAVGSSLLLVQGYGAAGVAVGYALAMVVQQLAMLFFARYFCGVWTHAGLRYLSVPIMSK